MSKKRKNKKNMQNEANNITNVSNIQKQNNTYEDFIDDYAEGYITNLYHEGIIKTIDNETLQKWFANPDSYMQDINNLLTYYYIVNGDIFQLYDLIASLPSLNYRIDVLEKRSKYEKDLSLIDKTLKKKVKHKQLTRDILSQLISKGTLVGMWLGNKNKPYFFIFDEIDYVFPSYRINGEWVATLDFKWFDKMKDNERKVYFNNLNPYITETMYTQYLNDRINKRYVDLPVDKSCILRTHTINRNQRLGLPWGLSSIFSIQHKQKLKDLETSISNKIINAISVLKINSTDANGTRINKRVKKKITSRVKTALEQNSKNGITLIAIPDYASFEFPEMKVGDKVLDPSKYESINNDISSGTGISPAVVSGTGGNYASGKMNLGIIYKKIGRLLEDIEVEVYDKLFKIILPTTASENYQMVYDKEIPLTLKEKIDILYKLHSEGYAVKPIIDNIEGVDYRSYIEQSIYEIEDLKLREKIIPPLNSNVISGKDKENKGGSPTQDDSDNPNTIASKTTGGNDTPRANE